MQQGEPQGAVQQNRRRRAGCEAPTCGIPLSVKRRAQATRPTAAGYQLRIHRNTFIISDRICTGDRPYVRHASQSSRKARRNFNSIFRRHARRKISLGRSLCKPLAPTNRRAMEREYQNESLAFWARLSFWERSDFRNRRCRRFSGAAPRRGCCSRR